MLTLYWCRRRRARRTSGPADGLCGPPARPRGRGLRAVRTQVSRLGTSLGRCHRRGRSASARSCRSASSFAGLARSMRSCVSYAAILASSRAIRAQWLFDGAQRRGAEFRFASEAEIEYARHQALSPPCSSYSKAKPDGTPGRTPISGMCAGWRSRCSVAMPPRRRCAATRSSARISHRSSRRSSPP